MALVTQVSNLRTYNLKFSDFGINQAVEQPIPVEPGRTISKRAETVSTGALGDIITDTRDLEVGRRKDDVTRLKAFLTSGKGVLFASKQAGLDQDLSLELNPRKRLTDAANTAARLANILLQAGSSGGVRLSSNPFGRYIEARGLVGQIGNLLRADAPSLAIRGRTIIPDYEARETTVGFFGRILRRLNIVSDANSIVENIDDDPTSLKSTLDEDGGTKFDKFARQEYAADAALETRRYTFNPQTINQGVQNLPISIPISVGKVDDRQDGDKLSLKKRLAQPGSVLDIEQPDSNIRLSISEKSARARRDLSGNFLTPTPYVTSFNNLAQAFDSDVSNIKIDIITPEITETLLFTAFIDSFSDSYTGNWNSTNYIGRAEPVYNYTGFNRDYSFNFKVASFSVNELKELYRKLNTLAGTTAPTYSGTFMRGTFVRLKIGDYLDSTPGFISSIGFSWNTTYPWQAEKTEKFKNNNVEGVYDNVPLLPHILDVSCNFTPIHNFIPQTNTNINLTDFAYIASTDLNNTLTAVSPETEQSPQEVQLDSSTGVPASNNEEAEFFALA